MAALIACQTANDALWRNCCAWSRGAIEQVPGQDSELLTVDIPLLVNNSKGRRFACQINNINRLIHHETIYAVFGMALKGRREKNGCTLWCFQADEQ